jgi:MFS-type transporter involved in bile tolerance (Atg22 family)
MKHTILRDGIVAGVLGATAVALWFLGVDTIYAHPLATPAALGRGLLRIFGPPGNEGMLTFVAAYTIFHYFAFIVAGILLSVIVHWAHTQPTVLAGAMMLFVAFEIGFYGLSAALQESPFLGALGWAQVATGNLIAAVVMGTYLWRSHPELKDEFSYALGGRE